MSDAPLPVLFVHSSDEMYGSDRILLEILLRLDRHRLWPIVVLPIDSSGSTPLSLRLREAGVEVHRRPLAVLRRRYFTPLGLLGLGWRLAGDVLWLTRLIRRRSVRVVYSNTTAVHGGALAARLARRPHVWHVHEIVNQRAVGATLRWAVRHLSTEVIAVSKAVAAWIATDRVRVHVVYNGIEPVDQRSGESERQRTKLLEGKRGPLIGWVGRVSSWKGHDVFVALAESASRRFTSAVFVLAGAAPQGLEHLETDLLTRLAASQSSDSIRYLGAVADGATLIGALDILVACPLRPDPFPRVVQEALVCGVPVLAVATGGLSELVVDGVTGVLVCRATAADLMPGLDAMLTPGRLAEMSVAARQDAVARFGMGTFVNAIQAVILQAVGSQMLAGPQAHQQEADGVRHVPE